MEDRLLALDERIVQAMRNAPAPLHAVLPDTQFCSFPPSQNLVTPTWQEDHSL